MIRQRTQAHGGDQLSLDTHAKPCYLPHMDFHTLNALHWGCSRATAKHLAFPWLYSQRGPMQDEFLDMVHPDVRMHILRDHGITLGEN